MFLEGELSSRVLKRRITLLERQLNDQTEFDLHIKLDDIDESD